MPNHCAHVHLYYDRKYLFHYIGLLFEAARFFQSKRDYYWGLIQNVP